MNGDGNKAPEGAINSANNGSLAGNMVVFGDRSGLEQNDRARKRSWVEPIRQFVKDRIAVTVLEDDGFSAKALLFWSFSFFVFLPALLVFLYYSIFAADIYLTETKLTVQAPVDTRGDTSSLGAKSTTASSLLSSLGIGSGGSTGQDVLIILDYLKSRTIVADLGGGPQMRAAFDKPTVDWFTRLGDVDDIDSLWVYWKGMVTASVDTQSNILTLKVRAFSSEESVKLSNDIVGLSERLINDLSERSRRDALKRSENEVDASASRLADARTALLEFQKENNTLNPVETAKQLTSVVGALTIQKIKLESSLSSAKLGGASERPGDRYIQTQIDVIERQIAEVKASLASGKSDHTIAQQLKQYELLQLRTMFAEQVYSLSQASYQEARQRLERQQRYVVTIVPPIPPDKATYPQPFVNAFLVLLACFVGWSILSLIAAGVMDSSQ